MAGIAILALMKGEKRITLFDWMCFAAALLGIVLWRITQDPLSAVVIVTIADTIAFMPTIRKAYFRPHEETASLFLWVTLKYIISLFALSSLSVTTALFPIVIATSNTFFVAMLFIRRRQLGPPRMV